MFSLAIKKASTKGTLQQHPYLQIGQQICSAHYTAIVENRVPKRNESNGEAIIPALLSKLSLGDQIEKMTDVLYARRHDSIILDPNEFDKMLEEADSDLKNFFAEMCAILIPQSRSAYNKKEDRKKIVAILYLMAGVRNKHASNFKLELALYLVGSGVTCDAMPLTIYGNKRTFWIFINILHP